MAEIAAAAWIDAKLVTQFDTTLVIDHNKVRTQQGRNAVEKILKIRGVGDERHSMEIVG